MFCQVAVAVVFAGDLVDDVGVVGIDHRAQQIVPRDGTEVAFWLPSWKLIFALAKITLS